MPLEELHLADRVDKIRLYNLDGSGRVIIDPETGYPKTGIPGHPAVSTESAQHASAIKIVRAAGYEPVVGCFTHDGGTTVLVRELKTNVKEA